MAIRVVCTSCRTAFNVKEEFAGRTGPCPKCKAPITIPKASEQVKVHAPENFAGGGRDAAGNLVLKPIAREQTKLTPVQISAVAGIVVVVVALSWLLGGVLQKAIFLRAVGLLIISPPLAVAAYTFLRDDEREPYRGNELWIRASICGLAYVILWGVFAYISGPGEMLTGALWEWLFIAPPLLAVGGMVPSVTLDLDYSNGFFHYAFYVLLTLALRAIAGLPWIWQIGASGGLG